LIFDSNTGQHISDFSSTDKEIFRIYYDVSPDGETVVGGGGGISSLVNIDTEEETIIQGHIFLLNDKNNFLVQNPSPTYLYFSENDEAKCTYPGIYYGPLTDRVRVSTAKNIFGSYNFEKHEFQVWKISNCELLYSLSVDW
jgi:hypothetical protein